MTDGVVSDWGHPCRAYYVDIKNQVFHRTTNVMERVYFMMVSGKKESRIRYS